MSVLKIVYWYKVCFLLNITLVLPRMNFTSVKDWPHSTFHRCVKQGFYPSEWGGGGMDDTNDADYGE